MLKLEHLRLEFCALALIAFLAAGCGGGEEGSSGAAVSSGSGAAAAGPTIDPASAATIAGTIAFNGTASELVEIDMSEETVCADKHDGPVYSQNVVVNDNGTLRNVFVYVKEGLGDMTFPPPAEPVELDQNGCRYHPHVFGIQVGQDLVIKNSDGLLHNINAKPSVNRGFNISQPVEMKTTRQFRAAEIGVPLECDVHGWMNAFVNVVDNPYYAVTGEDGSFSLAPLPPGTYVIEIWHEEYGAQTMEVTVGASETKEITFTFGGAAA